MPAALAEETLGGFFGSIPLRHLAEKKLFGGYEVPLGPVMVSASFWVFEVGCILGRAFRDRLPILLKMISITADGPDPKQKVCDVLCNLAADRMERYGRQPASLHDYWLKTEFDLDLENVSPENLKSLCLQRIPLEKVLYRLDEWLGWGIGFGTIYPQLFEDLWAKTFERIDEEEWTVLRNHGLALPERPTPMPLEDVERDILADTGAYVRRCFPELLGPLGLDAS